MQRASLELPLPAGANDVVLSYSQQQALHFQYKLASELYQTT